MVGRVDAHAKSNGMMILIRYTFITQSTMFCAWIFIFETSRTKSEKI